MNLLTFVLSIGQIAIGTMIGGAAGWLYNGWHGAAVTIAAA